MLKTGKELKKLLANKDVAAIKDGLADLSAQEIAALFDMEMEGKQREDVLNLIREASVAAADGKQPPAPPAGDPPPPAKAEGGSKKARGEETPAWMKPDYTGPMTVEIANWRNSNPDKLK